MGEFNVMQILTANIFTRLINLAVSLDFKDFSDNKTT